MGELINNHPDILYYFEPLYWLQNNLPRNKDGEVDETEVLLQKIRILEKLFQCKLDVPWHPVPQFLRSSSAVQNITGCKTPRYIGTANDKFEEPCYSRVMSLINDTDTLANLCRSRQYAAIKTIRLPAEAATAFIGHRDFEVKIVHLIRDPRGMLTSQSSALKKHSTVAEIRKDLLQKVKFCQRLSMDLKFGKQTEVNYPDSYMILRYEDVALNPLSAAKRLYDFIGIPMHKDVQKWIDENTKPGKPKQERSRTSRENSAKTAMAWKQKLVNISPTLLQMLEHWCHDAIVDGGYELTSWKRFPDHVHSEQAAGSAVDVRFDAAPDSVQENVNDKEYSSIEANQAHFQPQAHQHISSLQYPANNLSPYHRLAQQQHQQRTYQAAHNPVPQRLQHHQQMHPGVYKASRNGVDHESARNLQVK